MPTPGAGADSGASQCELEGPGEDLTWPKFGETLPQSRRISAGGFTFFGLATVAGRAALEMQLQGET